MYLKSEGVILSRKNFGEADRIVTIFTRDYGKITVLAKGVRRPRSKKAGHLELGNWCRIFVAKGKNLDLLTEIELKTAFGINEFSENKANKIYHFLEIVKNITPDGQRNQSTFVLLVHFLKQITKGEDFNLVSTTFKIKLLNSLGFFSTEQLKNSKTKRILSIIEADSYDEIKSKIKLTDSSYLKVLAFLDSMIEDLTEQKLKTNKFVHSFT
jgi:DNA repair protein RecO